MELDRRPAMVLRDAGIPDRPRLPDIGLVVMEPDMPPFPRERPRLRPRLLEVGGGPKGTWGREFEVKSPCVLALGGEEAEEAGWLLVEVLGMEIGVEEEELTEFLACCCCADGCGCCWVALL